jgi:hypothetical protein
MEPDGGIEERASSALEENDLVGAHCRKKLKS